ncbi:MAG: tyrosine-type recombinase/integrase [Paracoccaceae bacterium]
MARALTTKTIENLKPNPEKRQEVPDPALSGLYLVVQQTGVKSWALRYRYAGKPRKLTLGRWPVMGLQDARLAASEALEAVEHGRDPGQEKKAEKAARRATGDRDSIEALIDLYAKRHLSTLKSGATAKRELERHAVEAWQGREVHSITRRDVIDLLDSIVDSGRATTANRLRAYLGTFFNWCLERDVIQASPMVGVKAPAKEVSRDRVLSDDEIRWFWMACERAGQPWGPLGQLLLLTGQRLGEVAGMTEGELGNLPSWELPADRTKNGRAHSVPLSDAARDVLACVERIKGPFGYIHTTTGETPVSGFSSARNSIAKHMEDVAKEERGEDVEIAHWGFHDLRRTLATGMQRLGIPVRVTEAVLNHVSGTGGGIVAVYQRYDFADEKRTALDAWARFVASIVEGEAGNVVRIAK